MRKLIFAIILLSFFSQTYASIKNNIIENFSKIDNLNFKFTQTINGKDETGNCTIVFPKKIYCKYNFRNNKVLVSNGNSLVIKSDKNNQYYRYPLKDTALNLLLDKEFILKGLGSNGQETLRAENRKYSDKTLLKRKLLISKLFELLEN